jgi:hypothetical protein
LSHVHEVVGISVVASNAIAAGWGGIAWFRNLPSVGFWYVLRFAQGVVVLQVALGLFLLIGEGKPEPGSLHILYGVSPLVVTLVSEAMRVGAAERELEGIEDPDNLPRAEQVAVARRVVHREMGIMTIGALLILTLSLRALSTGL